MKTLTLQIPETLDIDNQEAAMLLATKLYGQGKLSAGEAAEMVGYSKRTFLELLSKYDVPMFNYDYLDIENDIKNAANYSL